MEDFQLSNKHEFIEDGRKVLTFNVERENGDILEFRIPDPEGKDFKLGDPEEPDFFAIKTALLIQHACNLLDLLKEQK